MKLIGKLRVEKLRTGVSLSVSFIPKELGDMSNYDKLIWIQNFVFPLMIDSLSPFFSMFDIYESEGSIELKKHISKNLAS